MNNSSQDDLRLIDAVLDGQAGPDEVRALEERLAADPQLREQYEDSKRIFDVLGQIPERRLPAAVASAITRGTQPFVQSRVSGLESGRTRMKNRGSLRG